MNETGFCSRGLNGRFLWFLAVFGACGARTALLVDASPGSDEAVDGAGLDIRENANDLRAPDDLRVTLDQQPGAARPDMGRDAGMESVAECKLACATDPSWHAHALCEDYQASQMDAYFCGPGQPSAECLADCSKVVNTAISPSCRETWLPFLVCLAGTKGYSEIVEGAEIRCDRSVLDLMSACWAGPYLDQAAGIWQAKRLQNYSYNMMSNFSPMAPKNWKLTVANGVLSQTPVVPVAPTIDTVLSDTRMILAQKGRSFFLQYDKAFGYPKSVVIMEPRTKVGGLYATAMDRYDVTAFVAK